MEKLGLARDLIYPQVIEKTMAPIIEFFIDAPDNIKKSVVFELLAIALCDKNYDDLEKQIIDYFRKKFEIHSNDIDKMEQAINGLDLLGKDTMKLICS